MKSRRRFLADSSLLALGGITLQSFNTDTFSIFKNRFSPADQVNIGAIGINGMGWADTTSMLKIPGVNLVAICDVDQNVIDSRKKDLEKLKIDASKVATYTDYRKLLDRKDIDAVIIGTPDHWHALIMVHAVEAGKDVYVEKPVGNSIEECRIMVAAQKKYNKAVQGGQWQRSRARNIFAMLLTL